MGLSGHSWTVVSCAIRRIERREVMSIITHHPVVDTTIDRTAALAVAAFTAVMLIFGAFAAATADGTESVDRQVPAPSYVESGADAPLTGLSFQTP
jgi:hypothetical protein